MKKTLFFCSMLFLFAEVFGAKANAFFMGFSNSPNEVLGCFGDVPEPIILLFLGTGFIGLATFSRKLRN